MLLPFLCTAIDANAAPLEEVDKSSDSDAPTAPGRLIWSGIETSPPAWTPEIEEATRAEASRRLERHALDPERYGLLIAWIDYDAVEYGLWFDALHPSGIDKRSPTVVFVRCPMCSGPQLAEAALAAVDKYLRTATAPPPPPPRAEMPPKAAIPRSEPQSPPPPPEHPLNAPEAKAAFALLGIGLAGAAVGTGLVVDPRVERPGKARLAVFGAGLGVLLTALVVALVPWDRVRRRARVRRQGRNALRHSPMEARF